MPFASELHGTQWVGQGELWMDPAGNEAFVCDCRMRVEADRLEYTWSHEGKPHTGRLVLRADGADFSDTFHSSEPMPCKATARSRALVDVEGSYGESNGTSWGWRITVAHRPSMESNPGALVLQMTNITPWGEEGRAVRMIARRVD